MEKLINVNTHQTVILDELKNIENEIDSLLPQFGANE